MQEIVFILPTKDNERQLDFCLKTLFHSTNYPFKVIIISSNTEEHPLGAIAQWSRVYSDRIQVIKTDTSGINIKAINIGINATTTEDVILIHDDMQFFKLYTRDWLQEMAEATKGNIGMVTYTNNICMSNADYLDGLPWIGSWFCYIPRTTIQKVGIMDESFEIGEDIDYSYRVQNAGLKLGQMYFWHEHHQMRSSKHNEQTEEVKKRNALRFKIKHGIK